MARRLGSNAKPTLHSPSGGTEAQFLHIQVTGAFECVDSWPTQLGAKPLKQTGQGENLCPHGFVERVKLRHKLVADLNNPAHTYIMAYDAYGLHYIMQFAGQ